MLASRLLLYGWLLGRCNSFKLFSAADLWKANHEKFSPALHSITPQSDEADTNFIRELGGYERLLSRITPNTDKNYAPLTSLLDLLTSWTSLDLGSYIKVSLSHGTAFIFEGYVTHNILLGAVEHVADRHPMLRAYISRDAELKKEYWSDCKFPSSEVARRVLSTVEVPAESFDDIWKKELEHSLNDAQFPKEGPLWMMKNFISDSPKKKSAWCFSFNHGSDDQQSINIVVKDLLEYIYSFPESDFVADSRDQIISSLPFPKSVEDAIAPEFLSLSTLKWSLFQLRNQLMNADMLPTIIKKNPQIYSEKYANPDNRSTFLEYFTLTKDETKALRIACRAHGVTITNALSAAILSLTSSFYQNDDQNMDIKTKKLRFLLSVGLRPFGATNPRNEVPSVLTTIPVNDEKIKSGRVSPLQIGSEDWTQGTVACASGAVDFVVSVPSSTAIQAREMSERDNNVENIYDDNASESLWKLAEECRDMAKDIIEVNRYVPESVRLFGFGMKYANILTIVDMEAKNPGTMGRGYSCGVSNVGLVNLPSPPSVSIRNSDSCIRINSAYYGTSHARNGVYCLLSSITVGETFCGCLQFTSPFISKDEAKRFKNGLIAMLRSFN